jgi:hypothetical protein
MEIIKWWKNKWVVLAVLCLLFTITIGFVLAYFIDWGWILSLVIAIIGGIATRWTISKAFNK